MEDLIAKGPISKYAQGAPAVSGGPIPEMLKNYMDVSSGGAWAWDLDCTESLLWSVTAGLREKLLRVACWTNCLWGRSFPGHAPYPMRVFTSCAVCTVPGFCPAWGTSWGGLGTSATSRLSATDPRLRAGQALVLKSTLWGVGTASPSTDERAGLRATSGAWRSQHQMWACPGRLQGGAQGSQRLGIRACLPGQD